MLEPSIYLVTIMTRFAVHHFFIAGLLRNIKYLNYIRLRGSFHGGRIQVAENTMDKNNLLPIQSDEGIQHEAKPDQDNTAGMWSRVREGADSHQ